MGETAARVQEQGECPLDGVKDISCRGATRSTHIGIKGVPTRLRLCQAHLDYLDAVTRGESLPVPPEEQGTAGSGHHTEPLVTPAALRLPWGENVPWPQVKQELIAMGIPGADRIRNQFPANLVLAYVNIRTARRASERAAV